MLLVAVGMRIVSNMKREHTSLVIYRNIKSSRTGSDSKAIELYDFAGLRSQPHMSDLAYTPPSSQQVVKTSLRIISGE